MLDLIMLALEDQAKHPEQHGTGFGVYGYVLKVPQAAARNVACNSFL